MVKEVPLCVCVCWGVVALSASAFFACLSLLWIPASCQSATVRARVFVLACMLPSEDFVESAVQCQWHIERAWWESPGYVALCLLHLFTPQNTLEFITPLTLSLLFPSICFFFSVLYISLISCWLLLTCHFKSVAVFRWRVCRQPGIISSLQGAGLSFISQPLNQKRPIFLLPCF